MTLAKLAVPQTEAPGVNQLVSWYLKHISHLLEELFQLPQVIQLLTGPVTE